MRSTFERDDEHRLLRVVASGPFDAAEVLAVTDRMQREGVWGYGLLYDFRGLTTVPTVSDLTAIAAAVAAGSSREARGPLALVVSEGEAYRQACAYLALGTEDSSRSIHVFRFPDEAEQWLMAVRR